MYFVAIFMVVVSVIVSGEVDLEGHSLTGPVLGTRACPAFTLNIESVSGYKLLLSLFQASSQGEVDIVQQRARDTGMEQLRI